MKKLLLLTKTLLAAALLCVGQNAWGDEVNATLDHTASSSRNGSNVITTTVDAEYEHYNNTKQAAWGGWAYAQFSFTIPAGHSIESATLTWSTSIGGNNTTTRNNDIYYVNAGTTIDYANLTSTTNVNLNGTFIVNVQKAGKTVHKDIETDVTSAVRAIAASQNYIIFKWTNSASGADLFGKTSTDAPTLVITTTTETFYTATFNANEGAITPSVTVYTDEERTTPIAKDALSANTTYYYRATLAGYNDYEGSFDVATSNPTVNFTMTAKTRYTFTVNAVDAGSNILKKIYTDADSYEGKTHNIVYPKYLTGTGNIVTYSKNDDTYGESKTAQAQNETYNVSYTAYDGVAYFVEVEDVVSATAYGSWNCSNGSAVRGFTDAKSIFTVPVTGVYDITYAACNNNVSYDMAVTLSKNDTEIATKSDLKSVSINQLKTNGVVVNSNINLTKDDVLKLKPSTTNGILDYLFIQLMTPVTVSAAGYATYVNSDYDLDFSATEIEAYKVKVSSKGVATLTKVDNVPAGTPVLLYKDGGATENIPVMTGAAAVSDNDLVAGTGAAVATIDGDYTNMILNNIGGKIGFYFAAGNTVAANRAYLHIATSLAPDAVGGARMAMRFAGDNITAVENVEAAAEAKAKEGKFIENGKLVIVKNGVKFNAAGAKLY